MAYRNGKLGRGVEVEEFLGLRCLSFQCLASIVIQTADHFYRTTSVRRRHPKIWLLPTGANAALGRDRQYKGGKLGNEFLSPIYRYPKTFRSFFSLNCAIARKTEGTITVDNTTPKVTIKSEFIYGVGDFTFPWYHSVSNKSLAYFFRIYRKVRASAAFDAGKTTITWLDQPYGVLRSTKRAEFFDLSDILDRKSQVERCSRRRNVAIREQKSNPISSCRVKSSECPFIYTQSANGSGREAGLFGDARHSRLANPVCGGNRFFSYSALAFSGNLSAYRLCYPEITTNTLFASRAMYRVTRDAMLRSKRQCAFPIEIESDHFCAFFGA